MIEQKVQSMIEQAIYLKDSIKLDIDDVINAQHENLVQRNDTKLQLMQNISKSHNELNDLLVDAMENGIDVNEYRDIVNNLEIHLKELYELNGKLASLVLPIRQMYKEIIDDITLQNGGTLLEVNV